jgi:hypothetical protein
MSAQAAGFALGRTDLSVAGSPGRLFSCSGAGFQHYSNDSTAYCQEEMQGNKRNCGCQTVVSDNKSAVTAAINKTFKTPLLKGDKQGSSGSGDGGSRVHQVPGTV